MTTKKKKLEICLKEVDIIFSSDLMRCITKLMLLDQSVFLSRRGQSLGSMGLKALIEKGISLPWEK